MTDTLMTEGSTQNAEGQQSTGQETATQQAGNQTNQTQGSEANTKTQEGQTEADKGKLGGAESEEGKPAGAPEKYDFKAPEGRNYAPAMLDAFSAAAKEADLPQDAAQGLLDKLAPAMEKVQSERIAEARTQWSSASRSDKEFGGDHISENVAVAQKALNTFGTPELKALLNETGLGDHPEVIRAFYRAGKAISEDRITNNSGGNEATAASAASDLRTLYPNSNLK
jgi:hypothetical protein